MKYLILSLMLFVASAFAAESTGTATTNTFTEAAYTGTYLPNPHKSRACWPGSDFVSNYSAGDVTSCINAGQRLIMCRVDLASFRTTSISGAFLTSLQASFDAARTAGVKCVMWFAYDSFGGSGNDATAAQIVAHLQQLKPYFYANADVIAFFKAGFIGAWGEWHSSVAGNTTLSNLTTVRDALIDAVHPLNFVESRYPGDIRTWWLTPLNAAQAYSGAPQARWGHHDDCQLSNTNTGTYSTRSGGATTATLQTYLDAMTTYASYGGELSESCSTPWRTTCASARTEFARWHLSWMKADGTNADAWTGAWTTEGCSNEIWNRVGYYFVLTGVTHQGTVTAGDSITVRVDMKNTGYSRIHSPYRLVAKACLVASPNTCYTGTASTTLRQLAPQATASTRVAVPITIPGGATTGAYTIRISAPDIWPNTSAVRAFAIKFANATGNGASWVESGVGYWTTGTTLTVN